MSGAGEHAIPHYTSIHYSSAAYSTPYTGVHYIHSTLVPVDSSIKAQAPGNGTCRPGQAKGRACLGAV